MKSRCLLGLFILRAVFAQLPAGLQPPSAHLPDLPDDAVVAEFEDGAKFTMGDFRKICAVLPPAQQQSALADRAKFLHQWAFFRKLAGMAEEAKLQEQSPYREAIEQNRMQILSEAKISDALNQMVVEPAEIVKAYETGKSKYTQVKVKAIYIAFSDDPEAPGDGRSALSEAQALAKARKLLAVARSGGDFVKLVRENSDDAPSREKDGDFDTLRFTDTIPDALRTAVFALQQGEITEPLKQPNGYYLLRAEEVTCRPLADVRDEIYNELKNAKGKAWLDRMDREVTVKILNPAFLGK
jgi:parvulin-like peptidyl-prolyl isomerase